MGAHGLPCRQYSNAGVNMEKEGRRGVLGIGTGGGIIVELMEEMMQQPTKREMIAPHCE